MWWCVAVSAAILKRAVLSYMAILTAPTIKDNTQKDPKKMNEMKMMTEVTGVAFEIAPSPPSV